MTNGLPDSWVKTEFGEVIVETFYGPRFSKDDYSVDGVPTIRTTDFSADGTISLIDTPRVEVDLENYPHFALRNGDILVTRSGSIGKCAAYSESLGPAIPSAYLIRVRVDGRLVESSFALTFLRSPAGQSRLLGASTAVTQSNVNSKSIRLMEFPLPPLSEQRRIVARIEELTARSKSAKEALQAIPPLLEKFRQSVLAAAFRGDLTAEWRQRNKTVDVRADLLNESGTRPAWEFDHECPTSWRECTLSEVCSKITDGTHDTPKTLASGVKYVTARNLRDGNIDFSTAGYVAPAVHKEIYSRCNPQSGDVLLVNIGAGTGTAALVEVDFEFSLKNVALLKPRKLLLDGPYLELHQLWLKAKIFHQVSQGGAQPFLSLKLIKSLPCLLPPLEEQREIASQVDRLLVAAINIGQIRMFGSLLSDVENAILSKAFRGELVPQDPTDEPASILLERIRVQKPDQTKTRSKARAGADR